jgi:hypothetical protein
MECPDSNFLLMELYCEEYREHPFSGFYAVVDLCG